MEEIICRGKQISNNQWIEGAYFIHSTLNACFSSDKKPSKHLIVYDGPCDWGFEPPITFTEVKPETVGEYTGKCDVNHKKIFEGDIVERYFFDWTTKDEKPVKVKNTITCVVEKIDNKFHMIELFRNYNLDEYLNVVAEITYKYKNNIFELVSSDNKFYFTEVIGNKWDNPELIHKEEPV